MSDVLLNAASYLWVALILYYFIQELLVPREGAGRWVAYIVGALLLLFVVWVIWKVYWAEDESPDHDWEENLEMEKDGSIDDFDDFEFDDYEDEKGTPEIPTRYRSQKRNFNLLNQVIPKESIVTYDYFKRWYLSPEFLGKYSEAIKMALKVKMKRLSEVRKQYRADLQAIKSKAPQKDGLQGILSSLDNRNDDRKLIETTLVEIDDLMKQIRKRYYEVNVESTRKSLLSAVNDPKHGIESLTGRKDIKDFLSLQLYTFAENPRIFFSNFQNMAIYGGAGLGKTKLAQVIGHVYAASGILVRNHVHVITKQSLTTAYVNESAKMTRKLLLANLESVVFIDEAYDLTPPQDLLGRSVDHGHEAIAEMVNFMDKMIGLSVIIVAGYKDQMEARFMTANEGLDRRFPHKKTLDPYNSHELTHILIKFICESCPGIEVTKKLSNYIYTIIHHINSNNSEIFKNQAGDMKNLSACIARAIYGSPGKSWPTEGEEILFSGVNSYLASKGHTLDQQ